MQNTVLFNLHMIVFQFFLIFSPIFPTHAAHAWLNTCIQVGGQGIQENILLQTFIESPFNSVNFPI